MQIEKVRAEFPSLALHENGRPTVFFDNAAGTQVPRRCIDRMVDYLTTSNANTGGVFATSVRTGALLDEARAAAADLGRAGAAGGGGVGGENNTRRPTAL